MACTVSLIVDIGTVLTEHGINNVDKDVLNRLIELLGEMEEAKG